MKQQHISLMLALVVCTATSYTIGYLGNKPDGVERLNDSGEVLRTGLRTRERFEREHRPLNQSPSNQQELNRQMLAIAKNPNPMERTALWVQFVKGLRADQFEAVFDELTQNASFKRDKSMTSMLLSAWAKVDPFAAMERFQVSNISIQLIYTNRYYQNEIITAWARNDPAAAMLWIENHHDGESASPWLAGLSRGLAPTDPRRAAELLNNADGSEHTHAEAINDLIPHLVSHDAQAAKDWAMNLQDLRLREFAINVVGQRLSKTDPEAVLDWYLANPSEILRYDLESPIKEVARRDPEAALAYMNQLGDQPSREFALRDIIEAVAEKDPQAAMSHMNQISNQKLKRSAFIRIATTVAGQDPQAALDMMTAHPELLNHGAWNYFISRVSMRNPELAVRAYAKANFELPISPSISADIMRWAYKDPESLSEWLKQEDLPAHLDPTVNDFLNRIAK